MRFEIELPFQPPLAWEALLEFLSLRAISGLERVTATRYERTIALGSGCGWLEAEIVPERSSIRLRAELGGARHGGVVVQRARRLFDLDADPRVIGAALAKDRRLAEIVRTWPGLRVPGCWDGFELAVRAVLGQQVTVRGAATLAARLVAAYGEPIGGSGARPDRLFPTPEALRDAGLTEVGLPRQRAETLRRLAAEVAAGRLSLEPGCDSEACVSAMTAIPGIGSWTAQYVAMRALREPDAFPASDLVLRRSAGGREGILTPRELSRRAQAWRPWRAYAAVHLWRASAPGVGRQVRQGAAPGRRRPEGPPK